MNLLEKAIGLALRSHAGQTDKGNNPYILHPLAVMNRVSGEKQKIVAVLHDVMEDCGVTEDDLLAEGFDQEIVDGIVSLTRKNGETYSEFVERCAKNELGRPVKIEDIKENLDLSRIPNPTEKDRERIEKYKKALPVLEKTQA